ncbi:GH39 family glycosyl hydrolase [Proteiniclasticum ruminis]|uniref:Xylan 1,4-beta-xylosidase n=1 Tax=Proteiniclasticum ruminis TaxID=398199 RepID=A0A1I5E0U9_9CLOT|nr:beta-xylosidase [Proteiniclasticum ruminis]SFO04751.1 xylan 1,4-beta-xylosidase [Proteiniclasticum ruminis]
MIRFTLHSDQLHPFPHFWEHCIGSCNAYTALREDYRIQLKRAHDELGFQYVRFHGLFDDQMSTLLMKKDHHGNEFGLVYNFANIDNIFDFLLRIGMKPFIELGFMPSAIARGDKTIFHYNANITPPKSYDMWRELVGKFIEHLVDRYGIDEVKTWFFEVWNEPNLFFFFDGTKEEYFKLYEVSARTIKGVHPELKVGGPATSCNSWIKDTVDYCRVHDVPLDFITTHHYPTDDPLWKSGMDIMEFFQSDLAGNRTYERGVLTKMARRVREEAGDYPVYFTEWNTSAMQGDAKRDEPYAAAMIAKTLSDQDGLVEGYSYWTFSDIFEESGQLPGAFHGGFGLQTFYGVAKPSYRVFELFHGLGNQRAEIASDTSNGTVEAIATKTASGYRIIFYNHTIPGEEIKEEKVSLNVSSVHSLKKVLIYRIDDTHANPKKLWMELGKPEYLKEKEIQLLHEESELIPENMEIQSELIWSIPAHGVLAVDLQC